MAYDTQTGGPHVLRRTLGLEALVVFGIAYIAPLGGSLAIYGELDETARGTLSGAYVLALATMMLTALSYGRMVSLYPVAGSAYSYTRRTLGSHLGFLVGWAMILDYVLLPMVAWVVAAALLVPVFPAVPTWAWVVAMGGATTAVNVAGLVIARRVALTLLAVQLLVLGAFILLAAWHVWVGHGPAALISTKPFFEPHVALSSTFAAAALAAISFLGFDAISTLVEESIEPRRNVRRAILLVAAICGALFVLLSYVTALAHPGLHFKHTNAAAEEIAALIGGDGFRAILLVGLITTQLAAGVAIQAAAGRLLYAMGRDRVLPQLFGRLMPGPQTPAASLVLVGLIGLLGIVLDPDTAISFVNFGAFIAFTFVNLSVIAHARSQGRGRGAGHAIGWLALPALGAASNLWLLFNLDFDAHLAGGTWLAVGIVYLLVLTRGLRRPPPELADVASEAAAS